MKINFKVCSIICFIFSSFCININLSGQNFEKHIWQNRILLIKSSNEVNTQREKQMTILMKSMAGLIERKIVLYEMIGTQYRLIDYQLQIQDDTWEESKKKINGISTKNNDFEVILIGLDGGVKLRENELLSIDELFGTIDRMPMRRAELRRGGKE